MLLRDQLQNLSATRDLIASDPSMIAVHRDGSRHPDGAGGFYFSALDNDVTLPAQLMFFSWSQYEPLYGAGAASGEGVHEKFVLVGLPNADIMVGDWFFIGVHRYDVQMMHDDRTYQTKVEGEAVTDGSDPS